MPSVGVARAVIQTLALYWSEEIYVGEAQTSVIFLNSAMESLRFVYKIQKLLILNHAVTTLRTAIKEGAEIQIFSVWNYMENLLREVQICAQWK